MIIWKWQRFETCLRCCLLYTSLSENAKAILSEEEQQEVLDNAGKWVISSLALYKNGNSNYDYEKKLSSIIDEIPADTILAVSYTHLDVYKRQV